ncbi:MAG: DUF134 domain-containing protein [Candidatus Zixiibacteriota bacterium]
MPRPQCRRRIGCSPGARYFKPRGVPLNALAEVLMTLDELEAMRLADADGLYHEEAATRMGVSRQTFGRIIESARRKAADTLCHGKALRIEGGEIEMVAGRLFRCNACGHEWEVPYGTARPSACPQCQSVNIQRSPKDQGHGRRHGQGQRGRARCGQRTR